MTEFSLRLPGRKASMNLIDRLDPNERDEFRVELLGVIWDAEEAGELPESVARVVRDWTARAHFATSPDVQERLAQIRQG